MIKLFRRLRARNENKKEKIEEDYITSCAFLKIVQFIENDKINSYEIIIKNASDRLLSLLAEAYQDDSRVIFVDSLASITSGFGLGTSIILRNKPNVGSIRLIKFKGDSDIEENLNFVILALEKQ